MKAVLESLVRGHGSEHAPARCPRELGARLLPEQARHRGHVLEIEPLGRARTHREPHHDACDRRMHARFRGCDPYRDGDERVERRSSEVEASGDEQGAEQERRNGQRRQGEAVRVRERDHEQHADVVRDHDRQDERAKPWWRTPAGDREDTERKRGVGRHHDPPAARRVAPDVECEVDRHG
jgi:hypothetical protein